MRREIRRQAVDRKGSRRNARIYTFMKKLIIFLFVTLSSLAAAQSPTDVKIIDKGIYKIEYSEYFRNPLKVTYTLYHQKSVVKRVGGFYKEPGVMTAG